MTTTLATPEVTRRRFHRISKSRYCSGLQCARQLWWRVHEPDAPELTPSAELQVTFDRGSDVGERARAEFPGGILIGHEPWEIERKLVDTRAALEARAPVIFEAAVSGDGVYAAIDVLRRSAEGLELIEVKSTYSLKPHFLPDVAIQVHAARAAGLDVVRATLMHLGREEACPFVHADVTPEVQRLLPGIAPALERMRMALSGPLPGIEPGVRCTEPYECPFLARCSRA